MGPAIVVSFEETGQSRAFVAVGVAAFAAGTGTVGAEGLG